jgi:hypothetical protein
VLLLLLLLSLQWRYAVGEDREALIKVTRVETEEDKAAKEKVHQIKAEDGTLVKLKVDKLLGRRKLKKDYEYEVQWQGKGPEAATWLTRDDLVEMGLEKMVIDLDMKEAARAVSTPLMHGAAACVVAVCICQQLRSVYPSLKKLRSRHVSSCYLIRKLNSSGTRAPLEFYEQLLTGRLYSCILAAELQHGCFTFQSRCTERHFYPLPAVPPFRV